MALDGDAPDHVALQAIRDALDRAGIPAKAEVTVELRPWERLLGDITGIATISRDEHRARQGLPLDDPPRPHTALAESADVEVIDAELVDPPTEDGPESRPSSPEGAMRGPDADEVPVSDMPPSSGGLMTLEGAADANRAAARVHRLKRCQ
jgi:hypothetical protein